MPFAYKTFITHYIGIPVYVFGYIGYKCTSNLSSFLIKTRLMASDPKDQGCQDGRDGSIYWISRVR
jgi:amino acid permease